MLDNKNNNNFIFELFCLLLIIFLIIGSFLYSNTKIFDFLKTSVKIDREYIFDSENSVIFSSHDANQLENILNQIELDYSNIQKTVPNFELLHLPKNLNTIEPSSRRKKLFISSILPLVIRSNDIILEERKRICNALDNKNLLSEIDILNKYGFKKKDISIINFEKKILSKIDIIPISLALSQAAVESGWGTSRFALEGNALFGQWVWNKDLGIKPKDSSNNKAVVRSFQTLFESVTSYMLNLNTHQSYSAFRSKRYRSCNKNIIIEGLDLVSWMENYAETRNDYVKLLRQVIISNDLNYLDKI